VSQPFLQTALPSAVRLNLAMMGNRVVVLHAFVETTQLTPDRELKLARKRLKELQDG